MNLGAPGLTKGTQAPAAAFERAVIDCSTNAVYALDLQGRYTFLNGRAAEFSGYAIEDLLGSHFSRVFPDERVKGVQECFLRACGGIATRQLETEIAHRDGTLRIVSYSMGPLTVDGDVRGVVGTVDDVTERRMAERRLAERERQLEQAERVAHLGSWEWHAATDRVNWSDGLYRVLGVVPGECSPSFHAYLELVHSDDRERVRRTVGAALRERKSFRVEERIVRPDGEVRLLELRAEVMPDAAGGAASMVGICRDITEERRAAETIRESEERYRQLVELSPQPIVVHSAGTFLYLNPAAAGLFGAASADDLVGSPVLDLVHPDSRDLVLSRIQQVHADKRPVGPVEQKLLRLDGEVIDAETVGAPIEFAGTPAVQAAIMDITARKRAERELAESERRYRLLAENATDLISRHDRAGRFLYASPASSTLTGYTPEELIGRTGRELIHAEDRGRVADCFRKVVATGGVATVEYRVRCKDGHHAWIESAARGVREEGTGRVPEIVSVTRDVTDRKCMEEQLRESIARFDLAARGANDGLWDSKLVPGEPWYSPKTEVYFSPRFKELLGFEDHEFENVLGSFESVLHPEDRDRVYRALEDHIDRRVPYTFAYRLRNKAGEYRWFEASGQGVWNRGGHLVRMAGSIRDVTDRKEAEKRLRQSEEHVRAVIEAALDAVVTVDTHGSILLWNQQAEKLFGWGAEEARGRRATELVVPLRFREALDSGLRRFQTTGEALHLNSRFELTLLRRDGHEFPVELTVSSTLGAAFTAFVHDISDRKLAEEQRAHHAAQLQGLAEAASAINSMNPLAWVLQIITAKAREIVGAHQAVTSLTNDRTSAQAITSVSLSEKYAAWREYDAEPDGSGIYSLACRMNEPMRMTQSELEAHPAWRRFGNAADRHPPLRGWLAAPLVGHDGKNIGLIQLSDRYEGEFTADDETILVQLAQMASVAIENVNLFEEAQGGRQRLRELSRRLVEAQEAERRRIARELHDESGQLLTAVKFALESVPQALSSAAGERLAVATALVDQLLERFRELCLDLRPSALDDLGLLAALLEHCRRYSKQTGVSARFLHEGLDRRFPPEIEIAAYRIVQEALTNVARHAAVERALVRACGDDETLRIQIEDAGVGFDPSAPGRTGGLTGMRERAELLGGRLLVASTRGAGTRVIAELPLRAQEPR
ncbi:MAG: hypothetical protein QOD06_2966 [Candidatus Binatota bacterium]|nr:hypothetical protein [Candidatus Binatota bacterium]